MKLSPSRLIAAVLLLLLAAAAAFVYAKQRRFSAYIADRLGAQAEKALGRKVKVGAISFSFLGDVLISDACVSRKPDFSRGKFFCADKAVLRPRLADLLRDKVYFSEITLESPLIKIRKSGGRWDFEDILRLLPDTSKGLHLTWNISDLVIRNATVEADMAETGASVSMERTNIRLSHYSAYGGNYNFAADGRLKTVYGGKLVSSNFGLYADANFDYGGLSSAKGTLKADEVVYGAVTLERLLADWDLLNIRKPLGEKKYTASISAQNLVVPASEGTARKRVAESLKLFSAAMGKPAPTVEDVEVRTISAGFSLDDSVLALKDILLRSNFMDLNASLSIDGSSATANAQLEAAIGDNRLSLAASGPLRKPKIEPLLSQTLSTKLKNGLMAVEKFLLDIYPVTGE
ncbi:MAG: hypothetical protein M0011_09315 [Elusimicrobia bacterium]|nr:hypothetical protein [Elusimicrobiota bacterium]